MTTTDDRPVTTDEPELTDAEKRLLAGRQLVAKILAAEVATLVNDERKALEPRMLPREAVLGMLPDGTIIGQVKKAKTAESAQVTDEKELLAWVEKNRPDEIVRSVRSSYVDALKAQAKEHGHAFDPATGEVIPGIEMVAGSSSYRPEPDEGAREIVLPRLLDMLASGQLLALPPARES